MKTSTNMTFMLVLFMFVIVVSPINAMGVSNATPADSYASIDQAYGIYCGLSCTDRKNFRFCMNENNLKIVLDFGKNCAQQIQFCLTTEECCEVVCILRETSPDLYAQYLECCTSATDAYSLSNPRTYPTLQECLENANKC
ncbi:uncharacterized protein LOC111617115 [Centruroides sculpturatus]|uniref:uncharacterized protein LOC111617115 n=1 Tax=Centruroides sculpturatus TaxID=218467 RepID=UPI000C6E8D25|nr:uncharacterized protein LOC111617115 [Centruroides sculpturatus]XP_023214218.1 uncharacterized protein LOC111617115 [Centruroides sculpturatus]XP_023214219.1 uncharacterized protein LOC111617115 [Centruroides sculpturatus]